MQKIQRKNGQSLFGTSSKLILVASNKTKMLLAIFYASHIAKF